MSSPKQNQVLRVSVAAGCDSLLDAMQLEVHHGQHWLVLGGSDQQREDIATAVRQAMVCESVDYAEVSFFQQKQLIKAEEIKAKVGLADEIVLGTICRDLIASAAKSDAALEAVHQEIDVLASSLGFKEFLSRPFRQLSSGETRRALLITAAISDADFYLLKDPYQGLDAQTRPAAVSLLGSMTAGRASVFVASRLEEMPASTSHYALIENDTVIVGELSGLDSTQRLEELRLLLKPTADCELSLIPNEPPVPYELDLGQPLIEMKQVSVSYISSGTTIFEGLDWKVDHLQHWRITGKNGSGKSTLLKLVSGDHPQVHANDITICGLKRGSGESIWDVKQYIGFLGGETVWQFNRSGSRVGTAKAVVVSGFYDTIGLYGAISMVYQKAADKWLALFDLSDLAHRPFRELSMAEQRLLLIIRAMVKRPALLILDEPMQGLDIIDRNRVKMAVGRLIDSAAVTVLYVAHYEDEQIDGVKNTLSLDDF